MFDLSLVTFSRVRRRVNPLTTAGKDHTSHRLVRLGFTQREAVLLLYLLGGAFGMVALFITQATVTEGVSDRPGNSGNWRCLRFGGWMPMRTRFGRKPNPNSKTYS